MSRVGTQAPVATGTAGFTLIEAMIAVAVVALLTAVALPAFQDAIRKSRRSDAYQALSAVQQAQERWRGNHAAYAASLTNAVDDETPGLDMSAASPKGHYTLSVGNASATGYAVTAVPAEGSSQAKDGNCQRLRIRAAGGNLSYGSAGAGAADAGDADFDWSASNRCWAR